MNTLHWESKARTLAEVNDLLQMPIGHGDSHRLAAFNKRAHNASMSATLRWADKLAQADSKPLPRARWWHGDPYGKPPVSTATWAKNIAKAHPPYAFIYDAEDVGSAPRNTYGYGCGQDGGIRIKRATDPDDARVKFIRLGVSVADL